MLTRDGEPGGNTVVPAFTPGRIVGVDGEQWWVSPEVNDWVVLVYPQDFGGVAYSVG